MIPKIIHSEIKDCMSCSQTHRVQTVLIHERQFYNDTPVEYPAIYHYCSYTDEYTETVEQFRANTRSMIKYAPDTA